MRFLRRVGIARSLWVTAVVVVLVIAMSGYDGTPATNDAEVFLAYGMLTLSFPVSLICAAVFSWIAQVLNDRAGIVVPTSYWSMALSWGFCFAMGYWQWFVVGPWVLGKLRKPSH